MNLRKWILGTSLLTMAAVFSSTPFAFSEDQPAAAEEEAKPDDAAAESDKSEEPKADPFEVPEGTSEELLKYIDGLRGLRPQGASREEMIESFKKAHQAMIKAADKVLAGKPSEEHRNAASGVKLEALGRLNQFGDAGAEEQLTKLAEELKAGTDKNLAKQAQSIIFQLRARKLMMGNTEGAESLLEEIGKQLADSPDDMDNVRMALGIAQALEYSPKTQKLAIQAYHNFAEIFAKSTNPEVVKRAEQLEGVIRRLELVGKPMELNGTLLDGQTFDQASLKGKVVLVDFWATWCGPCIAELPNVLESYKKYHDKGFDVIGISLDNDRTALETFVKDRELPWPILFEDSDGGKGWANPLATKYGIMGIPTVILIGADGNVVSLNARGPELGKLLEQLLGPAETKTDDAKSDEAKTEDAAEKSADSSS